MKDFKVTELNGEYYLTLMIRENGGLTVKTISLSKEYAKETIKVFGLEKEALSSKDLT